MKQLKSNSKTLIIGILLMSLVACVGGGIGVGNSLGSLFPGSVDMSFGKLGGILTELFITPELAKLHPGTFSQLTVQNDRKIIAVGSVYTSWDKGVVFRYLENGDLDPDFNPNGEIPGRLVLDTACKYPTIYVDKYSQLIQTYTAKEFATGVALDSKGRILVTGHRCYAPVVFRLLPNGAFDPTFGGGLGYVDLSDLLNPNLLYRSTKMQASRVKIIFGDHMIIVGQLNTFKNAGTVSQPNIITVDNDLFALRLSESGSVDTSFSPGGFLRFDMGSDDRLTALDIDSLQRILVGGIAYHWNFSGSGSSTIPTVMRLAPQNVGSDGLAANYNLDNSFAINGYYRLQNFASSENAVRSVQSLADGRILISGHVYRQTFEVFIARLNESGSADNSWNNSGFLFVSGDDQEGSGGAWQIGNKIVAASVGSNKGLFRVMRFLDDGAYDSTFGNNGVGEYQMLNSDIYPNAYYNGGVRASLAIDSYSRLILGGQLYLKNPNGSWDLPHIGIVRFFGHETLQP